MIIAPSVLSLDYSKFLEQLEELNKHADWIHFDVMDGHFVPNISFGPSILNTFRKNSSLLIDAHLMVSDPLFYADKFVNAGADLITFHVEACEDKEKVFEVIDKIKSLFVRVGISLKPNTSLEEIKPYLDKVDLVLVMSVEPGFGGQSFIESTYERINELSAYRKENNLPFLIEVDGGVNDQNAHKLADAGTDVLVAGSYVFNGNIQNNIYSLGKKENKNG